jgi:hypothetical protein
MRRIKKYEEEKTQLCTYLNTVKAPEVVKVVIGIFMQMRIT